MRGDFLHTRILVGGIEDLLIRFGALTHREHYARLRESFGYVDLLACLGSYTIVCEAELSPNRACKDVEKAIALRADLLLIVVPNKRIKVSVDKRLGARRTNLDAPDWLEIWVLPLGPALQRLRERCRLKTGLKVL